MIGRNVFYFYLEFLTKNKIINSSCRNRCFVFWFFDSPEKETNSDGPVFTDLGDEDNGFVLFAETLFTLPGDVGETMLDLHNSNKRTIKNTNTCAWYREY